jgi:hypothetical protein
VSSVFVAMAELGEAAYIHHRSRGYTRRVRLREIGCRERDREGEGAGMEYHPSPGQGGCADPGACVHRIRH